MIRSMRFSFGAVILILIRTYKFTKDIKLLKSRGRRLKQNFRNENHFEGINFAPNIFDHDEV